MVGGPSWVSNELPLLMMRTMVAVRRRPSSIQLLASDAGLHACFGSYYGDGHCTAARQLEGPAAWDLRLRLGSERLEGGVFRAAVDVIALCNSLDSKHTPNATLPISRMHR